MPSYILPGELICLLVKVAARRALATTLVFLASAGCGDPSPVGTWKFSGNVPDFVDATLTFEASGQYELVEQIAPPTTPAGSSSSGCVTTFTTSGTYSAG